MWLGMSSAFWYKKVQSVNVYTESLFFKLVLVGQDAQTLPVFVWHLEQEVVTSHVYSFTPWEKWRCKNKQKKAT